MKIGIHAAQKAPSVTIILHMIAWKDKYYLNLFSSNIVQTKVQSIIAIQSKPHIGIRIVTISTYCIYSYVNISTTVL